jgi:uncharacterized protein (UPF0333 family)
MIKKGQTSIEYIMTIAFVLTLIIPVSVVAYTSYRDYESTMQSRQALSALTTIANHAQAVYNIGSPSFSTIQVYFPKSISNIYVADNTLTARLNTNKGPDDLTIFSSVPMVGTLSAKEGTRMILITATDSGITITEP